MAEPRRFNVDTVRIPDVELTIDATEYVIEGSQLLTDDLIDLADIEERLLEAKGADQLKVAKEGSRVITRMVRRNSPRAPDFDLQPAQVLAIFAFIIGAESIAAGIVQGLSGGIVGLVEQTLAGDEDDATGGDADGGAAVDPLPPGKRSSRRSSRSAKGTRGARNGGAASAGARRASTSRTRSASS